MIPSLLNFTLLALHTLVIIHSTSRFSGMFFPLMKTAGLSGFLDLVYFPPNNWENRKKPPIRIHVIWPEGEFWRTEEIATIRFGENLLFEEKDFEAKLDSGICLLYPTTESLNDCLAFLPEEAFWKTSIPEWRGTAGFRNSMSQTSYQSEVFPLPKKGSLLTFHPFIQYGEVENRMLVLNITKSPEIIQNELYLFDSCTRRLHGKEIVKTNSLTTIYLDKYDFKQDSLPVFAIPGMAGIPFGLGVAKDGSMLSMEHTHPPASLVLFGDRNSIQSKVKRSWFNNLLIGEK